MCCRHRDARARPSSRSPQECTSVPFARKIRLTRKIRAAIACDLTSAVPRCVRMPVYPGVSLTAGGHRMPPLCESNTCYGGGGGRGSQYDADRELWRGPAGSRESAAAAGGVPQPGCTVLDRGGPMSCSSWLMRCCARTGRCGTWPGCRWRSGHRRGHGAVYDALNARGVDIGRLRWAVGCVPLPCRAGRADPAGRGRVQLAAPGGGSPARSGCSATCTGGGRNAGQMIPGWPYLVVAALGPGATSWTAPLGRGPARPRGCAVARWRGCAARMCTCWATRGRWGVIRRGRTCVWCAVAITRTGRGPSRGGSGWRRWIS